ncbi:MAG: hypothetical protein HGA78_02805 [Nitrospirales bacterium]|nr:hypothetical protein [Nitrospirales bacterium]
MVVEVFPLRADAERWIETKGEGQYEIKAMLASPGGRIFKEAIVCTDLPVEAEGAAEDLQLPDDLALVEAKPVDKASDIAASVGERSAWVPYLVQEREWQESFQSPSAGSSPAGSWTPWRLQ